MSKSFCKHEPHRVLNHIKSPKWSTNQVLISVRDITPDIENYIVQFTDPGAARQFGWFYLSGTDIRASKTQPNGAGVVYAVDMNKRKDFVPLVVCDHVDK